MANDHFLKSMNITALYNMDLDGKISNEITYHILNLRSKATSFGLLYLNFCLILDSIYQVSSISSECFLPQVEQF